jgi:hypothetical protein
MGENHSERAIVYERTVKDERSIKLGLSDNPRVRPEQVGQDAGANR